MKQGDGLSCLLFNFILEKVIRDSQINTKGTIYNKSIKILAYADDIDIVGRTVNSVKEAFLSLSKAAEKVGLIVNEGKTKFMQIITRSPLNEEKIEKVKYHFENVQEF